MEILPYHASSQALELGSPIGCILSLEACIGSSGAMKVSLQ